MKYYVDAGAADGGDGSEKNPFRTIQRAADSAVAGDEVIVAPGIYRESVVPKNGGEPGKPVVFRSEKIGGAHITGAEELKGWEREDGDVFVARVPNRIFGGRNPFSTSVSGDWFIASDAAHIGDVFLNGKSMYEARSLDEVRKAEVFVPSWEQDFSVFKWFAEQDERADETVIHANFRGKNPDSENVEISVRSFCFSPSREGVGYITLSGFMVSKAATQWAPPTAFQEGMVAPRWSKGWVIEDCEIFESKCVGISLGKYFQRGNDNKWLITKFKDGTQTQRDCVCRAVIDGWSRETVGSHTIRRCDIHDCGQAGIAGNMGGAFSVIEGCRIHHINNKQNLAGAEIGGIKLHAAIDVTFRRNDIHHCTRGIWLDWQAQGTRVTQNLFHSNTLPDERNMNEASMGGCGEDLFIEVSHGPTLVDNNIFLSDRAMKLPAQGVALVHNLIAGSFTTVGRGVDNGSPTMPSPRYTPYHLPHRTEIAGFMTILHGDFTFLSNIFVQKSVRPALSEHEKQSRDNEWDDGNTSAGTFPFDFCPSFDEWKSAFGGYCGMGSSPSDRYYKPLPVWACGNLYFNGARPMEKEHDAYVDGTNHVTLSLEEKDGRLHLRTNLYDFVPDRAGKILRTEDIAPAFEPEQRYENSDGSAIVFDEDFLGRRRFGGAVAGPFASADDASAPLF